MVEDDKYVNAPLLMLLQQKGSTPEFDLTGAGGGLRLFTILLNYGRKKSNIGLQVFLDCLSISKLIAKFLLARK